MTDNIPTPMLDKAKAAHGGSMAGFEIEAALKELGELRGDCPPMLSVNLSARYGRKWCVDLGQDEPAFWGDCAEDALIQAHRHLLSSAEPVHALAAE